MTKGIVIVAIAVVLFGGSLYIVNQQSRQAEEARTAQEKAAMAEKEAMQAKEDTIVKDNAVMEKAIDKNASRYVTYSKGALDQASDGRRVLYFYASWCPTCRPANVDFEKNSSKIPEDMVVLRVNYNDPETDQEEKDLAKKYNITYQHTFVQIDGKGDELTKWNGGQTEELLAKIK